MPWVVVALAGHLANALVFVIDKVLLRATLRHPTVYVFYIGLLGLLSVALVPFGRFELPPTYLAVQSAFAGVAFTGALLCFFTALQRGEASRVVPAVGGLVPVWTVPLATFVLGERLPAAEWPGFTLLVAGAVLIAYEPGRGRVRLRWAEAWLIVMAAALFASSFTVAKSVYLGTGFVNGFVWMRLFGFLSVLPLLALPATARAVRLASRGRASRERPSPLFFVGQGLGAVGFVLLNWGVKLAPRVAIVNALQGVQYAFLFLLTLLLARAAPRLLHERLTRPVIAQKTAALLLLAIGLALVA
jgi:uncharacterized membrane protein